MQPCGKHAETVVDLLYYYFLIKKNTVKCIKNDIRIYTKTHQIVPLFKNFLEGTCSLFRTQNSELRSLFNIILEDCNKFDAYRDKCINSRKHKGKSKQLT